MYEEDVKYHEKALCAISRVDDTLMYGFHKGALAAFHRAESLMEKAQQKINVAEKTIDNTSKATICPKCDNGKMSVSSQGGTGWVICDLCGGTGKL